MPRELHRRRRDADHSRSPTSSAAALTMSATLAVVLTASVLTWLTHAAWPASRNARTSLLTEGVPRRVFWCRKMRTHLWVNVNDTD